MPRHFTESEKDKIKDEIIRIGTELFTTYGIKKTSVEDITKSVGISKGSFYNFFDSKEQLYVYIFELNEDRVRKDITLILENKEKSIRERIIESLKFQFDALEKNPILRKALEKEDYLALVPYLKGEGFDSHIRSNESFLQPFLKKWLKNKELADEKIKLISSTLTSVFLLVLHKQDIGAEMYPKVLDNLILMIVDKILEDFESDGV